MPRYAFCDNTTCAYHAMIPLTEASGRDVTEGQACPVDPKNHKIRIVEVPSAPAVSAAATVGTLLPPLAYGGFELMFDDDDASRTWGKRTRSEPTHAGARYVAELQRDLIRLGVMTMSTKTTVPPVGKFDEHTMAYVLCLKKYLHDLGVDISEDMAVVRARAQTGAGPIYFYSNLTQASAVGAPADAWSAHLGNPSKPAPGDAATFFDAFASAWTLRHTPGNPEQARDLEALRPQVAEQKATVTALAGRTANDQRRDDLVALATSVNALEGKIDGAVTPIPPAASDGPSQTVSLRALQDAIEGLPGRITKAAKLAATLGPQFVNVKESARLLIQSAEKTLATYRPRAGAVLQFPEMPLEADPAPRAAAQPIRWELRPITGVAITDVQARFDAWLRRAPEGSARKLVSAVTAASALWAERQIAKPPGWDAFVTSVENVLPTLERVQSAIKAANLPLEEYRQHMRAFAIVDQATAIYARTMLMTGKMNGRGIFLNPWNNPSTGVEEIRDFPGGGQLSITTLRTIIDELKPRTEAGVESGDIVPLPLMLGMKQQEGGGRHTMRFGNLVMTLIGCDWSTNNGKNKDRHFVELEFLPNRLVKSRGWGIGQITPVTPTFTTPASQDGQNRTYRNIDGIFGADDAHPAERPLPLIVNDGRRAIEGSATQYIGNFNRTNPRRDCTYLARPFHCNECLTNLGAMAPNTFTQQGNDVRFRDLTVLRRLLSSKTEGGVTTPAAHGVGTPSRISTVDGATQTDAQLAVIAQNFPCSFVTALRMYNGGEAYIPTIIRKAVRNEVPPR